MAHYSGEFIYHGGGHGIPVRYTPGEWRNARLLPSFGLIANQGHKFWQGYEWTLFGIKIILHRCKYGNETEPSLVASGSA